MKPIMTTNKTSLLVFIQTKSRRKALKGKKKAAIVHPSTGDEALKSSDPL